VLCLVATDSLCSITCSAACVTACYYRQHCAQHKAPVLRQRYLSYLEGDFEVVRPTAGDVAQMEVTFGTEERTVPNFTPIIVTIKV